MQLLHQAKQLLATALFAIFCGLLALHSALLQAQDNTAESSDVIYAWSEAMAEDPRGHYPIELLKLALARSGQNYQAKPSKHELGQFRTLRHVELSRDLDVVWTFSTPEREQELLPIRIPIDRGLLGWRLLLIHASSQERIASLTVEQLKQLRSAQGHDWPDLKVLQDNGFNVSPSSSYPGLFAMLERGRIAYFPRSMSEIWPELLQQNNANLTVDRHWVLHYPAPLYFFVSKSKPELALAIETGLRAAIDDGSMKALFIKHFQDAITQADLLKRQVIELENTGITPQTPLSDASLWFDPEQGF